MSVILARWLNRRTGRELLVMSVSFPTNMSGVWGCRDGFGWPLAPGDPGARPADYFYAAAHPDNIVKLVLSEAFILDPTIYTFER